MRPALRVLDSHELLQGSGRPAPIVELSEYEPPDPGSFCLTITAEIGPENDEGADLFQWVLCTPDRIPDWLGGLPSLPQNEPAYLWANRVLLVREWSYERIRRIVGDVLARAEADDWPGVAARLSPYMTWEYEDYPAEAG
jgi:hypothetical protein